MYKLCTEEFKKNHSTTMEYTTLFHVAHEQCDRFMQLEEIRAFQAFYLGGKLFQIACSAILAPNCQFDKDVLRGGSAVLVPYRSIPVPDLDHPHIDCS